VSGEKSANQFFTELVEWTPISIRFSAIRMERPKAEPRETAIHPGAKPLEIFW
jgi:hypothetical protein